ncbi:ferritin [Moorella sp. Hama-1]|uniref:ferritin n=1 Tax=Moorella sp. Hama-1 TaxID=2138101 RepID=UPI000D643CD6|nr:ferritin [Moorella sp. Hama-1]BCV22052.1 ferritin [Moorella sp. Hama-1]
MADAKLLAQLNEQITREFYSAYLYLAMEAYLANKNLDGMAHFFHVQFQEELDHGVNLFNYVHKIGGQVTLGAIPQPEAAYQDPAAVFKAALAHERTVTAAFYELYEAAVAVRDHTTSTFLQWYITEQAEEEETLVKILHKLDLIGNDGMGLLMLDSELAQRVYTPPAGLPGAGPKNQ